MKISTLNEWLNESGNDGFLEPTKENLKKFDLDSGKVTINPDGSIDYDGDVNLSNKNLTKLPFRFSEVIGAFDCSSNKLFTLEGSPRAIGEDFKCYSNQLVSLEGGPVSVGGDFDCFANKLVNLEWSPRTVGRNFDCSFNQLVRLGGGLQKVTGNYDCTSNQLISLAGGPVSVGGKFKCSFNPILYNPTEYKGSFDIDEEWAIQDSLMNWKTHSSEDHLKMAFERLDELDEDEILGIEEGLDKVEMPGDLRIYCQNELFRYKVKFRPENKFQKALSGTDDEIIDMF